MSTQIDVILVDKNDKPVGTAEKLSAHQQGLLHRAFSVFIFREVGDRYELLLQRRKESKYHCGGLWTNTCCSHPYIDEDIIAAGQRRLKEEMGIEAKLESLGFFHYIADVGNGLTENEIDYVLIGFANPTNIHFNKNEVAEYRWINLIDLTQELIKQPQIYTPWFVPAFDHVIKSNVLNH